MGRSPPQAASPHQPRRRRECLGELVQIDGSEHRWFRGRRRDGHFAGVDDDATTLLMRLRFVASESAFDYFRATKDSLETHGKPVAFYSDKPRVCRPAAISHHLVRWPGKNGFG